jgi:hypothetical protein
MEQARALEIEWDSCLNRHGGLEHTFCQFLISKENRKSFLLVPHWRVFWAISRSTERPQLQGTTSAAIRPPWTDIGNQRGPRFRLNYVDDEGGMHRNLICISCLRGSYIKAILAGLELRNLELACFVRPYLKDFTSTLPLLQIHA